MEYQVIWRRNKDVSCNKPHKGGNLYLDMASPLETHEVLNELHNYMLENIPTARYITVYYYDHCVATSDRTSEEEEWTTACLKREEAKVYTQTITPYDWRKKAGTKRYETTNRTIT